VLTDVATDSPAFANEVFGPVAPITPFSDLDDAVALATETDYGLSLGILTRDVMKGVELADRIPSGIVHINDQTIGDEAVAPFGGVGWSGTGARLGGPSANIAAFTETQWLTLQGAISPYPF
jgi:benzaldehyde dehydrogenase (NAD)